MSAKTKKKLGCKMVFCEDPESGRLIVKPEGKCPEGYIERMSERVNKEGFLFVRPTSEVVDESELHSRVKPKVTTIEEEPDEDEQTATAAAQ